MPVQVTRTRLHDSQKLWVIGVMKPSIPPVSRDADVARGPAAAVVEVFERVALGEPRPHRRQRQILIEPALTDLAERHHLDQGQIHAASVRPLDQTGNSSSLTPLSATALILILRPASCAASMPARTCEIAPTGNGAELVGVERIERHVDALDAAMRLSSRGIFAGAASRWW